MLAVIFVIHDRPWRTVNNISQLLLCHAAGFTGSLDGKPYIVEIKSSFISLYLHQVIVFERLLFSYCRLFNFISLSFCISVA